MNYQQVEARVRAHVSRRTVGQYVEGSLRDAQVMYATAEGRMYEPAYLYEVEWSGTVKWTDRAGDTQETVYPEGGVRNTRSVPAYDAEYDPKF